MKSTIITLKELMRGNKRTCLLALRALGRCFECHLYDGCESKKRNSDYEWLQEELKKENERHNKEVNRIHIEVEGL